MSGQCLQHMQTPLDTEVTGVMHLLERSRFLSVGWNRRIATFRDEPDVSWKECSATMKPLTSPPTLP